MSEEETIILEEKDVKDFTVGIDEHGYLLWKIKLKDNNIYQIKYKIEPHITPKGNKSKRKIYFIRKDNKKLIFSEEVKKWFYAFRYPYVRGGI